MKTFISAADIEELAAQGVRELVVDEDTVLTAVAQETAAQCGVKLVAPGAASRVTSVEPGRGPAAAATAPTVTGKPKGCQHGPVGAVAAAAGPRPASQTNAGPVVDELIGAVKQLARK